MDEAELDGDECCILGDTAMLREDEPNDVVLFHDPFASIEGKLPTRLFEYCERRGEI